MKVLPSVLAALAVSSRVSADFMIYRYDLVYPQSFIIQYGFPFMNNLPANQPPSCEEAQHKRHCTWSRDVSGNKNGCVIEGPNDDVERFEFNLDGDDSNHYTIYKNRGYQLYDIKDQKVGECKLIYNEYHYGGCGGPYPFPSWSGESQFNCTSDTVHYD